MRTARQLRVFAAGAAVLAVAVAGCGTRDGRAGAGGGTTAPAARVPAAATLAPDGRVPWVNEPAGTSDFSMPTAASAPATGPACHASQLSGVLSRWIRKGTGGEADDPLMDASLYGYAVLTNTSRAACSVHGIPTPQVAANGTAVPLGHGGSRDTGVAVGLPPGGTANFRLDWDGPFCSTSAGPYTMVAAVPGTGDVAVRLADRTVPGCAHDDTHPDPTSYLTAGPVLPGDGRPRRPVTSPLSALTARAEPAAPAKGASRTVRRSRTVRTGRAVPPGQTVRPGQTVDFTVTLSNPTGTAVSLAGRPGFTLELLCQGTDGRAGLATGTKVYLLNNRPVHSVPAHGSVRFAVHAAVPADWSFTGPKLYVTWQMITRGLPSGLPRVVLALPTGS